MNSTNCGSIAGGWRRAEYINMTDAANSCPVRLVYYTRSITCFCSFNIQLQDALHSTFLHLVFLSLVCGLAPGIPVTVWTSRCIYFTTSTSYYCLYQLTLHWRTDVCDSQNSKEPHLDFYYRVNTTPTPTVLVLPPALAKLHLHLCEVVHN